MFFFVDQAIGCVVASFGVDVRSNCFDYFRGAFFGKDQDTIDRLESAENLGAIRFGKNGPACSLEFRDRSVIIDGDGQGVSESAGFVEIANVTGMEEIEASVGQNELFPGAIQLIAPLRDRFKTGYERGGLFHGRDRIYPFFLRFHNLEIHLPCSMYDPRIDQLAKQVIGYSTKVNTGDQVLLELFDAPDEAGISLIREVRARGGVPYVNVNRSRLTRELFREASEEQFEALADFGMHQMKSIDCYIAIRGSENISELSDVEGTTMQMISEKMRPVLNQRVDHTRWCVLRWPNAAMAQSAGMSTEAFEEFYFRVCLLNYKKLKPGMDALQKMMTEADEVHITGEDTDLRFSIKDIQAIACGGNHNIPDGECFTAPEKKSVNGHIAYNAPSVYQGVFFDAVRLEFKDGKIVKAEANDTEALNRILDTDVGARYIGEFALGFNPEILEPMRDILFDEKIAGSFHFTPGQAYQVADNGNRSAVHWDLVKIQRPEYGGGEIHFDGELIRKDGQFLPDELRTLNY